MTRSAVLESSPNEFLALHVYFPASSTVTDLMSRLEYAGWFVTWAEETESPSLDQLKSTGFVPEDSEQIMVSSDPNVVEGTARTAILGGLEAYDVWRIEKEKMMTQQSIACLPTLPMMFRTTRSTIHTTSMDRKRLTLNIRTRNKTGKLQRPREIKEKTESSQEKIPLTEMVNFFDADGSTPLEAMHSQSPEASLVRDWMWRRLPWIVVPDPD